MRWCTVIFKTIKRKYQGPSNPNKIRLNESKFRVFTEILSAHHRSGRNIGTRCNEIQFTWTVRRRAGTMRRPRTTSDWRWLSANGQMWPVIDYLLDFCWWYRRIKKNTHNVSTRFGENKNKRDEIEIRFERTAKTAQNMEDEEEGNRAKTCHHITPNMDEIQNETPVPFIAIERRGFLRNSRWQKINGFR